MGKTTTTKTDICIDLTEPWDVPEHVLDALASFDQLVAQIEGATIGTRAAATADLRDTAGSHIH